MRVTSITSSGTGCSGRLAVPGGRRYLVFDGDSFIGEAVGFTGVESLLRAWVRGFEAGQFRADLDEFLAELLRES